MVLSCVRNRACGDQSKTSGQNLGLILIKAPACPLTKNGCLGRGAAMAHIITIMIALLLAPTVLVLATLKRLA